MATAVTILRPMADNSTTICPTCRQPLRSEDLRHTAFSPESLPSIPLLPSINESSPERKRATLQVDTSVAGNYAAQLPSPHTVGEGKAKARARGWSMVNEDAAKAQREAAWNQYRKLAADLGVPDGEEKEDPVNLLKDTLMKVLREAEQLVSSIQPARIWIHIHRCFAVQRALFPSAKRKGTRNEPEDRSIQPSIGGNEL
jgi:hypothetical protein